MRELKTGASDACAMAHDARRARGGPTPKFTDYHIWKAMMALDVSNPVGRKRLAAEIGAGEGSTRTIISMLSEQGYLQVGKDGIVLTGKGANARGLVYMDPCPLGRIPLTIGGRNCAVRVPRAAKKVSFGCEERDAAIRSGATGATTLVCADGRLMFPGSEYPVDRATESLLRRRLPIRNDDAVVIGTAPTDEAAEVGAVTAGLQLMGGLRIKRRTDAILSERGAASELLSIAFAIHELVGGLPVCAKGRDDLGVRIEDGAVIDNAYTGEVLEEVLRDGTTAKKLAPSGPYKGVRVIVTPIEVDGRTAAAIGVVDFRAFADKRSFISRARRADAPALNVY